MLRRNITAVLLIAIVLLFLLFLRTVNVALTDILLMAFLIIGGVEMYSAGKSYGYKPMLSAVITFIVIVYPLFYFFAESGLVAALLVAAMVALALFTFRRAKYDIKDLAFTAFNIVYPMLFVSVFIAINHSAGNLLGILLILFIALLSDAFALFAGMLFGRKKLCPEISPKKTIAGAYGAYVGGFIGATAVLLMFDIFRLFDNWNNIGITHLSSSVWISALLYFLLAVICTTSSIAGDLVASWIKRQVGLKDYGRIFPGHGGVMDRLDSIIFTMPVVYVFFLIFNMVTAI